MSVWLKPHLIHNPRIQCISAFVIIRLSLYNYCLSIVRGEAINGGFGLVLDGTKVGMSFLYAKGLSY